MRKTHKVILENIDNGDRVKAVNIISQALANEFGKSCVVFQEGHASDSAIEAIPASVAVFVISRPSKADAVHHDNDPELIVNPSPQGHA